MTSNQLTPDIVIPAPVRGFWGELAPAPEAGMGFGLGFAVRTQARSTGPFPGPAGEYWWVGASGSSFVVDPQAKMITILLTQQPNQMRNYLAMTMQIATAVAATK
jgi:CubicO group peptidase (beta-lactamase class C family)